ncbi:hypothetical protein KY366_00560 [Candidatus Woesearchaeota archaeon]|nr:hypothetical protein [Candidatus Woesearchaeota archaeon]
MSEQIKRFLREFMGYERLDKLGPNIKHTQPEFRQSLEGTVIGTAYTRPSIMMTPDKNRVNESVVPSIYKLEKLLLDEQEDGTRYGSLCKGGNTVSFTREEYEMGYRYVISSPSFFFRNDLNEIKAFFERVKDECFPGAEYNVKERKSRREDGREVTTGFELSLKHDGFYLKLSGMKYKETSKRLLILFNAEEDAVDSLNMIVEDYHKNHASKTNNSPRDVKPKPVQDDMPDSVLYPEYVSKAEEHYPDYEWLEAKLKDCPSTTEYNIRKKEYYVGQVLEHKKFGRGIIFEIIDKGKMRVAFPSIEGSFNDKKKILAYNYA